MFHAPASGLVRSRPARRRPPAGDVRDCLRIAPGGSLYGRADPGRGPRGLRQVGQAPASPRNPRHRPLRSRLSFPPASPSLPPRPEDSAMLRLDGVEAAYGLSRVLHGVTLEAREGEVVSLLGRNGAGKSTTLKAIVGLVEVTAGGVCLGGRGITGLPYLG